MMIFSWARPNAAARRNWIWYLSVQCHQMDVDLKLRVDPDWIGQCLPPESPYQKWQPLCSVADPRRWPSRRAANMAGSLRRSFANLGGYLTGGRRLLRSSSILPCTSSSPSAPADSVAGHRWAPTFQALTVCFRTPSSSVLRLPRHLPIFHEPRYHPAGSSSSSTSWVLELTREVYIGSSVTRPALTKEQRASSTDTQPTGVAAAEIPQTGVSVCETNQISPILIWLLLQPNIILNLPVLWIFPLWFLWNPISNWYRTVESNANAMPPLVFALESAIPFIQGNSGFPMQMDPIFIHRGIQGDP